MINYFYCCAIGENKTRMKRVFIMVSLTHINLIVSLDPVLSFYALLFELVLMQHEH